MTRWTARQSLRSNRFAADLISAVISTLEVRLSSGAKPKQDSPMSDVLQVCSGDILGNLPDEMSGEKTFFGGNVQSADVTIEALSDEAIVIKGIVLGRTWARTYDPSPVSVPHMGQGTSTMSLSSQVLTSALSHRSVYCSQSVSPQTMIVSRSSRGVAMQRTSRAHNAGVS
jgi:hypothetical protein